jgi:hypothetical protein
LVESAFIVALSVFFTVVSVFIVVSVFTVVESVTFVSVELLPQDAKAPMASANNTFFMRFEFFVLNECLMLIRPAQKGNPSKEGRYFPIARLFSALPGMAIPALQLLPFHSLSDKKILCKISDC